MKKFFLIILCCVVLFAYAAPAAASISISYEYKEDGTTLTTTNSLAIVDTFDSGGPAWSYTGKGGSDWGITSGSSNQGAAPYNYISNISDNTNYLAIRSNSLRVDFNGTYNYLGLFWGSIDNGYYGIYNTIEFLKHTESGGYESVLFVTSDEIISGLGGGWTSPTDNLYVNFHNVPDFDAVRFSSNHPAFELDNLAVAVPVPATILLGFLGLGVGGWKLRKSKK
jgi:hypothetical protein